MVDLCINRFLLFAVVDPSDHFQQGTAVNLSPLSCGSTQRVCHINVITAGVVVHIERIYAATVPTLVVPLEKTLSRHIESRYKALTEKKVGLIDHSLNRALE